MIGERIELRRKELRIASQSELARRAGISQQTLNSIIKNNPRSTPHIVKLANALKTTPAYLMAETDDPEAGAPEEVPLDYFQRELLDLVAMLTPVDRKAVLQIVRSMVGVADPKNFKGFSETLHSPRQEYRGKPGK